MEYHALRNSLLWYACSVVAILAFFKRIHLLIMIVGVVEIYLNSSEEDRNYRPKHLEVFNPEGGLLYKKGGDARRAISHEPPKRYQSACGLSGILPLEGTNQNIEKIN